MREGWVFTSSPLGRGLFLCILQTPVRFLSAKVGEDKCLDMMAQMCKICHEAGDE